MDLDLDELHQVGGIESSADQKSSSRGSDHEAGNEDRPSSSKRWRLGHRRTGRPPSSSPGTEATSSESIVDFLYIGVPPRSHRRRSTQSMGSDPSRSLPRRRFARAPGRIIRPRSRQSIDAGGLAVVMRRRLQAHPRTRSSDGGSKSRMASPGNSPDRADRRPSARTKKLANNLAHRSHASIAREKQSSEGALHGHPVFGRLGTVLSSTSLDFKTGSRLPPV